MLHFPDILGGEGGLFWLGGVQSLPGQTMQEIFYLFIYLIIQKYNVCRTSVSELWHVKEWALLLPAPPPPEYHLMQGIWSRNVEISVGTPISPYSVIPGLYIRVHLWCCAHHIFHTDFPLAPTWASFPVLTSSALLLILRDGLLQKPP